MFKYEAEIIVGGTSNPSKMPGFSHGTPSDRCNVGSKLKLVPGSVCFECYTDKGFYTVYKDVIDTALERRYQVIKEVLSDDDRRVEFIEAFQVLTGNIGRGKLHPHIRIKDSGDLSGYAELALWCDIARACPDTMFWLPTREYALINTYLGEIPDNLTIRVSAHMIDHGPPVSRFVTSTVHSDKPLHGFECRAPYQDNECRDCRACWNPAVNNITYHQH